MERGGGKVNSTPVYQTLVWGLTEFPPQFFLGIGRGFNVTLKVLQDERKNRCYKISFMR